VGREYTHPVPVFVQAGLLGKLGLARLSSRTESQKAQTLEQKPDFGIEDGTKKKHLHGVSAFFY
jgi:hypothetical protein